MGIIFGNKKKLDIEKQKNDLDMNNIPQHIGIIMDGNGRWAKERNLPRTMGHKAGVEAIRKILKYADTIGIKYITFYAFSTENWKRPKEEVGALMKLMILYFRKELNELHENNVIIKVLGNINKLPDDCIEEIVKAQERTKNNTGISMNLAINYGGRDEIISGIRKLVEEYSEGIITMEDINTNKFNDYLYTANMPDPDMIIRPSGEQRISNFLLWQCAYSEFWYSNINWPDFTEENLCEAIIDYQKRNRRFGGLK